MDSRSRVQAHSHYKTSVQPAVQKGALRQSAQAQKVSPQIVQKSSHHVVRQSPQQNARRTVHVMQPSPQQVVRQMIRNSPQQVVGHSTHHNVQHQNVRSASHAQSSPAQHRTQKTTTLRSVQQKTAQQRQVQHTHQLAQQQRQVQQQRQANQRAVSQRAVQPSRPVQHLPAHTQASSISSNPYEHLKSPIEPPSKRSRMTPPEPGTFSIPLDLSKSRDAVPLDLSSKGSTPKGKDKDTLDLSSKESTPKEKDKDKEEESEPIKTMTLHQCPFCKTACNNPLEMRNHLDKCKAKEIWFENNIAPLPSTSDGSKTREIDSLEEVLRPYNSGKIVGSILIKEEPEDSGDDIQIESMDNDEVRTANKEIPSVSAQLNSTPTTGSLAAHNNSRPVLTLPSALKEKQKSTKESTGSKDDKTKESEENQKKKEDEPPLTINVLGTLQSASPTKSSEKRPAKRPSERSIQNIADTLIRRMTQRSELTEQSSLSDKDKNKDKPQEENVQVETPNKDAEEKVKEVSPDEEPVTPISVSQETPADDSDEAIEDFVIEALEEEPKNVPVSEKTTVTEMEQDASTAAEEKPKEPVVKAKPKKGTKRTATDEIVKDDKPTAEVAEDSPAKTQEVSVDDTDKSAKKTPAEAVNKRESRKRGASPTKSSPRKKAPLEENIEERVLKGNIEEVPVEKDNENMSVDENVDAVDEKEKEEKKEQETKPAKESSTPSKPDKKMKSPVKKSPKSERLSKDEVADITKLACDLGCLRRSSRAKPTKEEESNSSKPSSPEKGQAKKTKAKSEESETRVEANQSKKNDVNKTPITKSKANETKADTNQAKKAPKGKKIKQSEPEKSEDQKTPKAQKDGSETVSGKDKQNKTTRAAVQAKDDDSIKEKTPKKTCKTTRSESEKNKTPIRGGKEKQSEDKVVKEVTQKDKDSRAKRQSTLAEAFAKEGKKEEARKEEEAKEKQTKKKEAKQTKQTESGSKVARPEENKKTPVKKNKQKDETETTIFDKHVAALKPRRGRPPKNREDTSKTDQPEDDTKTAELKDKKLKEAEMEAVEELVRLSQTDITKPQSKQKKEKKSASSSKVDDIYNRHIAALKGRIKKKGKVKKKALRNKKKEEEVKEDEYKISRVSGRKAYKTWLEKQDNVKDKTAEIYQRNVSKASGDAKEAKLKQGKEDDTSEMNGTDDMDDMDTSVDIVEIDDDDDPDYESSSPRPRMKRNIRKYSSVKKAMNKIEIDLECTKCKKPVRGRKDFNEHMMCHSTDEKMTSCPVCCTLFRNKNRCWGHMLRDHAGWRAHHECPYCGKVYSRKDAVHVHVATVHPAEHRREMAEKMGCSSGKNEDEEFRDEDVVLDLVCKRCNRPIQNKSDCYTHTLLHSPRNKDDRRFLCPMCDMTGKDSAQVWSHVLVDHADIKPFACSECNEAFASQLSLKAHQQKMHQKFLEPIARVRTGFDSENWDIGINHQYKDEPRGPLPLSSGNVISLLDLALNQLVINQHKKIQSVNEILTGHNTNFGTIMSAIFSNGNEENEPQNKNLRKDKDVINNNSLSYTNVLPDVKEDPAVIASRKMIPPECNTTELPCVLCPVGITGAEAFKLHVLKHICDSSRICPVCRRTFSRKSSCRQHLVEHTFYWQHKCDLCSHTFPKDVFLSKHYSKHHEHGYQCLNCLQKFDSEDALWQHVNAERDISTKGEKIGPREYVKFSCRRVHVCTKCHQEFKSAWGLQYHLDSAHNDNQDSPQKSYECAICGKKFKSSITLRNHMDIHEENATYSCQVCNLVCRTKRQLTKHMEYKHMEKIYKCSYCPKMFSTRSRLKEHAIMHQNKTFICDMCGKVYKHQRVFETHCRQHFKPPVKKHRLFPCPRCNHMSKSKEQLNLHIRRHTGERPYACKQCPKAFSSQTGLWRHKMSHAGTKPHKCTMCGKTFVQKCSLDRHLLSHAGIKPYRCEYCSAEYSQSYPLTKHMERKHPSMPFVLVKREDVPSTPKSPKKDRSTKDIPAEKVVEKSPNPVIIQPLVQPEVQPEILPVPSPAVPVYVDPPTIRENDVILAQL